MSNGSCITLSGDQRKRRVLEIFESLHADCMAKYGISGFYFWNPPDLCMVCPDSDSCLPSSDKMASCLGLKTFQSHPGNNCSPDFYHDGQEVETEMP